MKITSRKLCFVVVDSMLIVTPIVGIYNCSRFCCALLMSILVLQSYWWGREAWLLCFVCLSGVSWLLCCSSSRCHGYVCSLWLWYFLIILTYYFGLVRDTDALKKIYRLSVLNIRLLLRHTACTSSNLFLIAIAILYIDIKVHKNKYHQSQISCYTKMKYERKSIHCNGNNKAHENNILEFLIEWLFWLVLSHLL